MADCSRLKVAVTPGTFEGKPHFLTRHTEKETQNSAVSPTFESRFGVSTEPDKADIALFPFDLSDVHGMENRSPSALAAVIESNYEQGLRTVCVMWHDYWQPLTIGQPQAIILRSSMVRGLDYTEEFPIPVNFETINSHVYADQRCGYVSRPRIGFMGSVPRIDSTAQMRRLDEETSPAFWGFERREAAINSIVRTPVNIGTVIRSRCLAALQNSDILDTDVVTRDAYFGFYSVNERAIMRQEYSEHMMRNDYIFCPRGAGNYSTRLFETIAAGRIPVLVDTDLVMPFADVIPWQEIAVWVPMIEIDRIDEYVLEFHSRLRDSGYWALKNKLRNIFETYLTRDGMNRHLESFLMERL